MTMFLIGALCLALAAYVVPGIYIDNWITLFIVSFIFGVVNASARKVLVFLSLPITNVTIGLFLVVVNAAFFALAALVVPGFYIKSFISALIGWVISVITLFLITNLLREK